LDNTETPPGRFVWWLFTTLQALSWVNSQKNDFNTLIFYAFIFQFISEWVSIEHYHSEIGSESL
jgi:hypothetical protein